jgi:hypothetical protein
MLNVRNTRAKLLKKIQPIHIFHKKEALNDEKILILQTKYKTRVEHKQYYIWQKN